ncbi:MAG: AF1514 family protein [Candidatus Lindowbacteria bacterium]|nr:AF1514 family protein [Candidatus Lindowbacteria bacterium]
MKTIKLNPKKQMLDFASAEKEARKAAMKAGGNVTLVSYYDRAEDKMVPRVSCMDAGEQGHRIYAESHGADIEVTVNDGAFDFYFFRIPDDALEPEKDHRTIAGILNETSLEVFENVLGG